MGLRGKAQILEHAVQLPHINRANFANLAAVSALGLAQLPAQRLVDFETGDH
jgi:hypothetical protein